MRKHPFGKPLYTCESGPGPHKGSHRSGGALEEGRSNQTQKEPAAERIIIKNSSDLLLLITESWRNTFVLPLVLVPRWTLGSCLYASSSPCSLIAFLSDFPPTQSSVLGFCLPLLDRISVSLSSQRFWWDLLFCLPSVDVASDLLARGRRCALVRVAKAPAPLRPLCCVWMGRPLPRILPPACRRF